MNNINIIKGSNHIFTNNAKSGTVSLSAGPGESLSIPGLTIDTPRLSMNDIGVSGPINNLNRTAAIMSFTTNSPVILNGISSTGAVNGEEFQIMKTNTGPFVINNLAAGASAQIITPCGQPSITLVDRSSAKFIYRSPYWHLSSYTNSIGATRVYLTDTTSNAHNTWVTCNNSGINIPTGTYEVKISLNGALDHNGAGSMAMRCRIVTSVGGTQVGPEMIVASVGAFSGFTGTQAGACYFTYPITNTTTSPVGYVLQVVKYNTGGSPNTTQNMYVYGSNFNYASYIEYVPI